MWQRRDPTRSEAKKERAPQTDCHKWRTGKCFQWRQAVLRNQGDDGMVAGAAWREELAPVKVYGMIQANSGGLSFTGSCPQVDSIAKSHSSNHK